MIRYRLTRLFINFLLIGLISFGGGISMLPFIKRQAMKEQWIQPNEWQEIVTIAQLFPGAIAVNLANLIGFKVQKHLGSLIAIFGMILPPIIVISLLALGLQSFLTLPIVLKALDGMLMIVLVLIFRAVINLSQVAWQSLWMVLMSLISFTLSYWQWLSPLWVMVIATGVSLTLTLYPKRKK